jgi:hypothetical protein
MKTIIATMTAALMSFAAAGNSSAAEVSHSVFKGLSANAAFNRNVQITCDDGSTGFVSTFLAVSAFNNVSHLKGVKDTSTAAAATLLIFNTCNGSFSSGTGVISEPDYSQQNVSQADLTGTFTVFDESTGAPLGTVVVDLTWSGVGPVDRNHSTFHFQSGPFVFNSEQTGSSRAATLSGSVTVDGVDFLPFVQHVALSDSKSGSVVIQRK